MAFERAAALCGPLARAVGLLTAALVLAALALAHAEGLRATAERRFEDFGLFYESAARARSGGRLYGSENGGDASGRRPVNLNSPFFSLFVLPFTSVDPPVAFRMWCLLSGASWMASLFLIAGSLAWRPPAALALGAVSFAAAPMVATVMTGQMALLLLLPVTLAWRALREGREIQAGFWLGLCTAIKPFFLLFAAWFVVTGRPRAAGAAAATAAGASAIALAAYGVDEHRAWIASLSAMSWIEHYLNGSLLGWLQRSLAAGPWRYAVVADRPDLVLPLWLGLAGAVGVLTLWRVGRLRSVDRQWLLVTTAALLVSPLGWLYYFWLLLPPLTAVVAARGPAWPRRRTTLTAVGIAGLMLPPWAPWLVLGAGSAAGTITLGSAYCWTLLALWWATLD